MDTVEEFAVMLRDRYLGSLQNGKADDKWVTLARFINKDFDLGLEMDSMDSGTYLDDDGTAILVNTDGDMILEGGEYWTPWDDQYWELADRIEPSVLVPEREVQNITSHDIHVTLEKATAEDGSIDFYVAKALFEALIERST